MRQEQIRDLTAEEVGQTRPPAPRREPDLLTWQEVSGAKGKDKETLSRWQSPRSRDGARGPVTWEASVLAAPGRTEPAPAGGTASLGPGSGRPAQDADSRCTLASPSRARGQRAPPPPREHPLKAWTICHPRLSGFCSAISALPRVTSLQAHPQALGPGSPLRAICLHCVYNFYQGTPWRFEFSNLIRFLSSL